MGVIAERGKILVLDDNRGDKGTVITRMVEHDNGTEVKFVSRGDLFAKSKEWLLKTHEEGKIPIFFLDQDLQDALNVIKTGTEILRRLMEDTEISQRDMKILLFCTTNDNIGATIAEWADIPGVREHCCVRSFNILGEEENYKLEDELEQFYNQFRHLKEPAMEVGEEVEVI